MKTIMQIYVRGRKRQWRWRMLDARNRRIIGASSESYLNRHQAVSNLKRVTGIKYVPHLGYGTKLYEFKFSRDGDGAVIHQEGR